MNYMVAENETVRGIMRNIKDVEGDVIIPAAMLRRLLHELQKRRKQMSKPQKNKKLPDG